MKENSFAHGNLRVPHIIVAADLKPMILIFHYESGPRRVTREPLHLNARQFPWLTGDRNVPIVFSLPGFQPRLRPSRTTGKLLRWNIFASMLATNNGNEELKSSFAEIRVRSALKVWAKKRKRRYQILIFVKFWLFILQTKSKDDEPSLPCNLKQSYLRKPKKYENTKYFFVFAYHNVVWNKIKFHRQHQFGTLRSGLIKKQASVVFGQQLRR